MDKFLKYHTYKITVIHWIKYMPFEQPGPAVYYSSLIIPKYLV